MRAGEVVDQEISLAGFQHNEGGCMRRLGVTAAGRSRMKAMPTS
jgi:hypothetical protein